MNFFAQLLDPIVRFERKYAEHLINRFRFLPRPSACVALETEWIEPRGLTAALARDQRIVVTGAAGMGKTTTLAYLAVSHARTLLENPHARVPISLSARELQSLPHLADLPRALNMDSTLAAQCPRRFFANVVAAGRALVLVDDIDVLPPAQVGMWLPEFANARIIATSQATLAGFAEFPLPGFRDGDIATFAKKWCAANASAFLTALKASAVPRTLTAHPMSLTLLAHIWRTDHFAHPRLADNSAPNDLPTVGEAVRPLPMRRADLFYAFARNVLGDSDETARMLEDVASAIQRGNPASNGFLSKSHGFLRASKHHTTEFTHALWQAYFAARALCQSSDLAPLTNHLSDPSWRETILFYAGMGDADALVEALVARGDVFLAGHAIAHARAVRAELCKSVTQELMRRAWDGEPRAVAALSEMSSEIAADGFAAKLEDKDAAVRTRAAEILGQLQLDRGIEYLLPWLRDANPDVRDNVVEALGRSRTDRVIEPLLVALRGTSRVGTVDTRLRVAAARALGEIASDKAVPALVVAWQLGEPEVRAAAAEALKRIKSPLISKPLEGILASGDDEARKYAADVLAVIQ
jgi:HEAT repeat protein